MKKLFKNEDGNVIAFTAIMLVVLFGFAVMGIDVGYLFTAKNQLQSAVDSAALAGAAGLMNNQAEAINQATHYASLNLCIDQPVQLSGGDITFPTSTRIRIQGNHTVNMFFAKILGYNTVTIGAVAAAEISQLVGTGETKPWAIPDFNWPIGAPVVLKAGALGAPGTDAGFFYPVDFPPLEGVNAGTPVPGAQAYEQNILNGSEMGIFIDDVLLVEPGNMVGPTIQGVNVLIGLDPNAYWDGDSDGIAASGFVPAIKSPRVIKVPLYDPDYPPDSGRDTVTITGLAAFFIMSISGRDVMGVFMEITTSGTAGSGNTYLYGVNLVE